MSSEAQACVWFSDGSPWEQTTYGLPMARKLEQRGYTVTLADLRRAGGDVPQAGLHVLAGGSTGVGNKTWMPGALFLTRRLVDLARSGDIRLRGICLGGQMIATALAPASVIPAPAGLAARLSEITWADGRVSVVPSFHYCRIDSAQIEAAGATVLASNAHAPVQAFAVGEAIRVTQFHPEWDPGALRQVLRSHPKLLSRFGRTVQEALADTDVLAPRWDPGLLEVALALPEVRLRRRLSRVA